MRDERESAISLLSSAGWRNKAIGQAKGKIKVLS
jgi:hypothetical protein